MLFRVNLLRCNVQNGPNPQEIVLCEQTSIDPERNIWSFNRCERARLRCVSPYCDGATRCHSILAVVTRAGYLPGHFFVCSLKAASLLRPQFMQLQTQILPKTEYAPKQPEKAVEYVRAQM
jgi:hypothetical protein